MQKIGTFREWLNQEDNDKFYNELKIIEKEIQQIQAHNDNHIKINLF